MSAKLTATIRDAKGQIPVSKGAAITARIVQIRRFYVLEPSLRLVLKLEAIDIDGMPRPLAAAPDSRAPAFNNSKVTVQRRYNQVTLDKTLKPQCSSFGMQK